MIFTLLAVAAAGEMALFEAASAERLEADVRVLAGTDPIPGTSVTIGSRHVGHPA